MTKTKLNILIIGEGAWGSALAVLARSNNHIVTTETRTHVDASIPYDAIIFALPSDALSNCVENRLKIVPKADIIIATKGMMHQELELFSTYFERKFNIEPIFLSGPNFANEVSRRLPASADIACKNIEKAQKVCDYLSTEYFTLKPTDDDISVQLAGCYKNILAIYCGYLSGLNMGDNMRAKICTEGIAELKVICQKLGGKADTIDSYSGIGDIILSCFSDQSRNFRYGRQIATSTHENLVCVEGIKAAKSLAKLCNNFYKQLEILPKIVKLIEDYEGKK